MRAIAIITAALLIASPAVAKTVSVKSHITKQGVYKPPSYRTSPNGTKIDNYSSKPNVNPYTGKTGAVDPLKTPSPHRK